MDPTNNPMQNLNSVPGGSMPGVDGGMGMNMGGPAMSDGGMPGGAPMGGANMISGAPVEGMAMGGSAMGGPTVGSPVVGGPVAGGTPLQGVGGPVSPGQMFQAGGVAAPMGALGAVPGDYSSSNSPLLGATDPITMPDGPKAPDPVEVELNAPFKAAAPVPGSIGSAISVPGDPNQQVPNVAFNDPAMMAPNASMMPKKRTWSSRLGMDGGKKMDKKTMIILGSIVAVIVVAVVAVVVIAL